MTKDEFIIRLTESATQSILVIPEIKEIAKNNCEDNFAIHVAAKIDFFTVDIINEALKDKISSGETVKMFNDLCINSNKELNKIYLTIGRTIWKNLRKLS